MTQTKAVQVSDLSLTELVRLMEQTAQHAEQHPMLGRRCVIRTYSAGVHIGRVVYAKGREVMLDNALRLWSWEGGGLSLSAIANVGVVKARIDRTGVIYITEAIEFIPTTPEADATYEQHVE